MKSIKQSVIELCKNYPDASLTVSGLPVRITGINEDTGWINVKSEHGSSIVRYDDLKG